MLLDPQAQLFLDQMAALDAPAMHTLTPEQVRENIKLQPMLMEPEPVAQVEDRAIPGPAGDIPVRIYRQQAVAHFPSWSSFTGAAGSSAT